MYKLLAVALVAAASPILALICPSKCLCPTSYAPASGSSDSEPSNEHGEQTVVCDNLVFRHVPAFRKPLGIPRDTVHLHLRNVSGVIQGDWFSGLTRLVSLRVSGGTSLRLSDRSLAGLHSLRSLTITDTDLTSLRGHVLALLPRLQSLDLSRNQITGLGAHQFTYNTHLSWLNLSSNLLLSANVNDEAFTGMDRLKVLDLSSNRLRRAPAVWFLGAPTLETLDLSVNSLSKIGVEDTKSWSSLRFLNISRNEIAFIEPGAFNSTINLSRLDISRNYLSSMLGTGLAVPELNIGNNSFTVANRTYIDLPENLVRLDLSNCFQLHHVGRNLLQRSLQLETVIISRNPSLTKIEHTTFNHLDELQTVDLSDNTLEKLPRSLSSRSLKTLKITGNSFTCDCSLGWLRDRASIAHQNGGLSCRLGESVVPLADGLSHVLCEHVSVVAHQTQAWVQFNETVDLECHPAGVPKPSLTWITPQRFVFHWHPARSASPLRHPDRHTDTLAASHPELDHYRVLADGRLRVRAAASRHQGRYVCLVENDAGDAAASVYLTVGVSSLHDVKMMALLLAMSACLTAVGIVIVVRLGMYLFYKCGCCTCCTDELPPKDKKVKSIVESVDQWRVIQLASLRDSYNQQVANIKDSCYQQVERIRDTYKGQTRYLGDMRDFGAQQFDGLRGQYLDQVRRVRDYSLSQMNRVHENYIFQRNRIRKFSAHQRVRLRETCKYQQKTLNKILENLPDLYLQNCRTGTCQRTDSVMLGEQFECQVDIQWSAEELAAFEQLFPPGDNIEEDEEPAEGGVAGAREVEDDLVGPEEAGAELTWRLRALAPSLEDPAVGSEGGAAPPAGAPAAEAMYLPRSRPLSLVMEPTAGMSSAGHTGRGSDEIAIDSSSPTAPALSVPDGGQENRPSKERASTSPMRERMHAMSLSLEGQSDSCPPSPADVSMVIVDLNDESPDGERQTESVC